jgi:hypothetical protein
VWYIIQGETPNDARCPQLGLVTPYCGGCEGGHVLVGRHDFSIRNQSQLDQRLKPFANAQHEPVFFFQQAETASATRGFGEGCYEFPRSVRLIAAGKSAGNWRQFGFAQSAGQIFVRCLDLMRKAVFNDKISGSAPARAKARAVSTSQFVSRKYRYKNARACDYSLDEGRFYRVRMIVNRKPTTLVCAAVCGYTELSLLRTTVHLA